MAVGPAGRSRPRAGRRGAGHGARGRRARRPSPLPERRPGRRRWVGSTHVRFGYHAGRPVLDGFHLELAPGSRSRSSARPGAGSRPSPGCWPLLRRRRRRRPARRCRPSATFACTTCAAVVGIVFEDTFLFTTRSRPTSPSPIPTLRSSASSGPPPWPAPTTSSTACRTGTTRCSASAGYSPLRRPAPAHRHRPGDPGRPQGAGPRRRHRQRSIRPRSTRSAAPSPTVMRRPDHHRHRPPPGDDRPGRSGRPARRGRVGADGTHDELLATQRPYREVLAAAAPDVRPRPGTTPAVDGHRRRGRLSARRCRRAARGPARPAEAPSRPASRAGHAPGRPQGCRGLVALIAVSTAARSPDRPGSLRHRPRAHPPGDAPSAEPGRGWLRRGGDRGLRGRPAQQVTVNRVGEGFLRDIRVADLPATCSACRCRSTTARRRGSRGPADLRHRLDERAGPVRPVAVRRPRRCSWCSPWCCCS